MFLAVLIAFDKLQALIREGDQELLGSISRSPRSILDCNRKIDIYGIHSEFLNVTELYLNIKDDKNGSGVRSPGGPLKKYATYL
jgi:hypothetical protein